MRIAIPAPKIMELPIACKTRKIINTLAEAASPQNKEETVKIIIPQRKTLFLPVISAARPAGIRKTAADNKYEVAIQPTKMASALKAAPIDGSATLMEDPMKGVRNEAMEAENNTAFFSDEL